MLEVPKFKLESTLSAGEAGTISTWLNNMHDSEAAEVLLRDTFRNLGELEDRSGMA